MIKESLQNALNELDWKTYMNASKKRKKQADELRDKFNMGGRNSYDDKADDLEKYAQKTFNDKHGKDGNPYQWEGSPNFKGRYTVDDYSGDNDFKEKAPTEKDKWWKGEKADGIRKYRHGKGLPYRELGLVHDDEMEYAYSIKDGWSGTHQAHRTDRINQDGVNFDPYLSSDTFNFHGSKNDEYNNALDNMRNNMKDYYTGKSKYIKGKGWTNESKIKKLSNSCINDVLNETKDTTLIGEFRAAKNIIKNFIQPEFGDIYDFDVRMERQTESDNYMLIRVYVSSKYGKNVLISKTLSNHPQNKFDELYNEMSKWNFILDEDIMFHGRCIFVYESRAVKDRYQIHTKRMDNKSGF